MKNILLLIVSVLLIATFVDTKAQVNDWQWSNPRPAGETMRWCQMFDANTYYAAGYYGMFVKTTDGGATWKSMCAGIRDTTGGNESIYGGYFFNANTGFLCGSNYIGTNNKRGIIRTTDAGATWTAVGNSANASRYKMYFLNNNIGFVCGSNTEDVAKTTDGGLTWTDISGNIGGSTKYCIYAWDVNNIIVGTTSADLYKTTNGGTNWTLIGNYGGTTYGVNFIDANTGFMCGSATMIMKTINGGTNWTSVSAGMPTSTFQDIDFGPPVVLSPKLFQNFEATTWPPTGWTNTGTTTIWSRSTACSGYGTGVASARAYFYGVSSGTGILTTVAFAPTSAGDPLMFDHAYANYTSPADDSLIIRYSTNGGSSYSVLSRVRCSDSLQTAPNTSGSFVPTATQWGTKTYVLPTGTNRIRFEGATDYGNNLYLDNIQVGESGSVTPVYITGNPFNIYKSTDLGVTWDTVGFLQYGVQTLTSTYYEASFSSTGDTIFTVGDYGYMNSRYSSSNRVFHHKDRKISSTLNCIGVVGNKVIAGGSSGNVVYSTDRGVNWDSTDISGASTLRGLSMINNNNGWICGSSGKTYKTSDGGASWTEVTNPATSTLRGIKMIDANTGWVVGSSGKIINTTNGGSTWATQTSTMGTSTIYSTSFVDANTGWVCGTSGKVSKTTNGGTNWTSQTSKFHSTLRGIDFVDGNNGYMCGSYSCVRGTTDGGTTWDTLHLPFTYNISLYALDFYDKWNGLVVGYDGITFRTRDAGATWIFENTASYNLYSVCMASTDSAFGGCSYGKIIQYGELLTGTGTYTHQVPEVYELYQNYPNPFNPTTTIQFALPKDGMVSLKIYDVTGRLVNTLINNEGLNEGTFKYIFDGSSLASGVYFYSLLVDDNLIDSKKMVLIK